MKKSTMILKGHIRPAFFLIIGTILCITSIILAFIGIDVGIIYMLLIVSLVCLILGKIFLAISVNIIEQYESSHPEEFFGGETYRAKLYSITRDIKVYTDLSKSNNILNSEKTFIEEVIIQKTSNKYYYREIVSGKLIPVSYVIKAYYEHVDPVDYINFNNCVFILIEGKYIAYRSSEFNIFEKTLTKTTYEEVKKYIEEREGKYKDCKSFSEYLDCIFKEGEKYYIDAENKSELTDSKKISNLLSTIKNN